MAEMRWSVAEDQLSWGLSPTAGMVQFSTPEDARKAKALVEQMMADERERCAQVVEFHVIRDHSGKFVLDPTAAVFDRNTSLLAAAMNIRGGK